MATTVTPFGSVELALKDLLVRDYAPLTNLDERIGGEFPGTIDQWYIRIDKVPGGSTNSFEGDFILDIDVFSDDYLNADKIAHDIEAVLLAHGYHVVISAGKRWVFDDVFQNIGVSDRPWDGDDDVFRMSATYTLTARRMAGTGTGLPLPPPQEGSVGEGGTAFAFEQESPLTIWTIEHNLGYRPGGVRVAADNGNMYFPVIVDLDENTVRLTLPEAVSGWAYLS
jgi:hypothetical protein